MTLREESGRGLAGERERREREGGKLSEGERKGDRAGERREVEEETTSVCRWRAIGPRCACMRATPQLPPFPLLPRVGARISSALCPALDREGGREKGTEGMEVRRVGRCEGRGGAKDACGARAGEWGTEDGVCMQGGKARKAGRTRGRAR